MTPHQTHIVVWKRELMHVCPVCVNNKPKSLFAVCAKCNGLGWAPSNPEKKSFRVGTLEEVMETQPDGENWEIDEVYPVEGENDAVR